MIKNNRSPRSTFFKGKKIRKIFSIILRVFLFLMIINLFSSDFIYNSILQNFQNNGFYNVKNPKTSTTPNISVDLPYNYSLHGKIAPDYSINITGGPGNYTWYEFLETGEKSTPMELNGLLEEVVSGTLNQDLWNNLNNGTVTIRFYANDSLNNIGYSDAIVRVDIIAPEKPDTLIGTPSSWTNIDSFNISWSNPPEPSGIAGAYYKLDEAPTSDDDGTHVAGSDIESIKDISVLTDGVHDIYVWLVDMAGNVNYTNYEFTQLYLDTSDPLTPNLLEATPSFWTNFDSFNISWTNPSDTSGIVGAYYKLDEAPTSDDDGTYVAGSDIESIKDISVLTDGVHDIYVWLVDMAGNVNYTNYEFTQLYLDTSDPIAPSDLIATPNSWTNIDSFNLSWSNPSDTSGIVGAYYKLDEAPTFDDDGTYVAGSDIESIQDISVLTDGVHDIYVWLVDAVGNVNFSTYVSTQLFLDTSISSPSTLTATPSSWTNIDSFNLSWSNPSDMTEIIGAYYKIGDVPTSDDDGIYIAGSDIESILNISVLTDGVHNVYIWLVDAVGNVNYSTYVSTQLFLDTSISSPSILTATPSSWTNIDSFNLSWSNPSDMTEIIGAYYKIGNAPTSDDDGIYIAGSDIESILNISVLTDGVHNIYVWLVDAVGNVNYSTYVSTQLYLDTSIFSPSTLIATPSSWTNIDSFNLSWSNPSDMTEIVGAYYKIGNAPTSDDDGIYIAGSDIESIKDISVLTDGVHNVYVWLIDAVGNVNYSTYEITHLFLDTLDPTAPSALAATPSSWTRIDSYNLSWINPSDTSGIIGAYYKLDGVPTSNDDGTYVAGSDIESILNISVLTDGIHEVYVWLVDMAGNVNCSNYLSTHLYLDTSDPMSPIALLASPDSWSNIDNFNISWLNPSDLSGIIGAYYKIGDAPTSDNDGIYIAGSDIELIPNISVSTDGNHTIYVWLVDSASNLNHSNYATTQLYLDRSQPSIIDSQLGDDIWRDSGGTTYNIDFSDSIPSSNLDFAQYRITSEPDQAGIVLKDWTYIFTNLGATDYTANWPIDFTACQEGFNYISVRVYDIAGNNVTLNDVFYVKKDTLAPKLIINKPYDQNYYNSPPPINVTVLDLNFNHLTYTVVGYLPDNIWLENNTEVLLNQDIWDDLPQGLFLISITAYDDLVHSNNTVITLYKDTIAPSIIINAPENSSFWNSAPFFNVSAFDPNLDTIWYSVNNINITLTNNSLQQLDSSIWEGLTDEGEFQVYFYANDSFGYVNKNFTFTLYKDVLIPNLIINSPYNNSYWKLPPIINVAVRDSYLHTIWYRVGDIDVVLSNNTNQQLDSSIWDGLPEEGEFIISFYANDTSGNLNNKFILNLNKDIKNPSIIINNPKENKLYGDIAPQFDISIIETNLNHTWYILIGGSSNHTFSGLTGQIDQTAWDEFGNGTVTIRFYANDTLGNLGSEDVTIRKNIYSPVITIISPQNNELFGIYAPNFTIYKSGLALNTTWYTLDNGLNNYSFYGLNGTIDQIAWDLFGFENITIRFYINDSLGKIGFDEVTVRKDPYAPEITIIYINPTNNNSYCSTEPIFRVSVFEPNLHRIWYRVGNISIEIANNTEITLESSIWDNLPQGKFIIEIFAEDILGYINDPVNLTFYKDTLAPKLVVNKPYDHTYYDSPPPINITVLDPNFNSLTYTVIGYLPVNIWLENNTETLLNQDIWDDLPQGEFLISITAYDDFGHPNNTYITLYKDTIAPILLIAAPTNNSYWNTPPLFNVIAFDPNLDTIWYQYGTTSIVLFNNTEQLFDSSLWASTSEGWFYVDFFANDTFGKISTLMRVNLTKDITTPLITIFDPMNNTYYSNPPSMNIIASDINLDTLWYTVMGTKIILTNGPEPLDAYIWNNLPQGEFQVLILANDSAGNLNDNYILTLYKDTIAPVIFVNSPQNKSFWNSRPILNIIAYDPNLDSLSYSALGYSSLPLLNNTDELFNNLIWTEIAEGIFIVEIFAEDIFGHKNSINLTLYKDTIAPDITINFPYPNGLFGNTAPDFEISVDESYLNTTWYTLIGEGINITFIGSTGSINQTLWDKFGNGTVIIRFYANDTVGNIGYSEITVRKDIFAPVITISSPGNDDIFGINSPNFIIYKSGPEIHSTWYTLDNGLTNITFTGLSGKINQDAWDNYDYEIIIIKFYINNTLGKIGCDEIIVRKDPDFPIILVNSPLNQTAFALAPLINLTIIEPNLDAVWYILDDIRIDLTSNLTQYVDSFIWNNLPQGTFILELFANDTLGNLNSQFKLYLIKDTIGPNITIILPSVNQEVDRNAPFFELTLFDENDIDLCWYTIDGVNISMEFTGTIGRIDQDLWESIWDNKTHGSIIIIRFYSRDTLGNINYQEIIVIKHQPPTPFKIFSNPLGFIFSTVGLGIMFPITIKLTKSRYYENLNKKEKGKLKKVLTAAFLLLSVMVLFYVF